MNDNTFSNDSYLYFQDLSTSHLVETEPSTGFNYFNSISNTFHNQQHQQPQQAQQQQISVHQLQHVGHVQQPNAMLCNLNNSNNNSGNNNSNNCNSLNGIPFVQIHTTDVHQVRTNYGNVFRRQTTKQEEIKSEPIKSEGAENSNKENTNTTPTPPSSAQIGVSVHTSSASNEPSPSIITNGNCDDEQMNELLEQQAISNGNKVIGEDNDSNLRCRNINTVLPEIFKCSQCAFISLSKTGVQQHVDTSHNNSNEYFPTQMRRPINCPGCANIFYAHNSLFVHLCEDHQMILDDANKLLQAFEDLNSELQPQTKLSVEEEQQVKETQPKIYLKNVACLRDPAPRVLEEQLLQLNDSNYFQLNDFEDGCNSLLTDVVPAESDYLGLVPNVSAKDLTLDVNANVSKQHQSNTKQKISIKSVDVLREPALLRRDFEMQQLNILSGGVGDNDTDVDGGECNEHELSESQEVENHYNFSSNMDLEHNEAGSKELSSFEKPRRPKIYIKNVDILKEPLVLPSNLNGVTGGLDFNFMSQPMQQTNVSNFLNNTDAAVATTQAQVFDGSAHLCIPSMVPEPSLLYDGSTSNTFLQNISELDSYALAQNNNNNNFLLESPKYHSELQGMSTSMDAVSEPPPIVIESTPPPVAIMQDQSNAMDFQTTNTPQQKQKIFIKNAEILKQPQFHEQRRTLHLRTVDELNLMNKTEVENLIAPNLDASAQNQDYAEHNNNSNNVDNNSNCTNNNLNTSADNSKNSDESNSYSNLNFKINEVEDTQTLHNWTSGYSLGAELDCIITDHSQAIGITSDTELALQKQLYDLETPQMSVISVLDIEELTDEQEETSSRNTLMTTQSTQFIEMQEQHDAIFTNNHAVDELMNSTEHMEGSIDLNGMQQGGTMQQAVSSCQSPTPALKMSGELKHEQLSNANTSESCTPVSEKSELIYASSTTSPALSEAEPVTKTTAKELGDNETTLAKGVNSLSSNEAAQKKLAAASAPEKGRIYVADNLLKETATAEKVTNAPDHPVAVSITGGTSNRGRPFGSNRTGITKIRKLYGNAAAIDVGMKCNVQGCAFRFKKLETLEYHKRCHSSSTSSPQSMICPECQSTNFSNWNTLHTHLWRTHQVDMELYSCELCQFKTPIYSRLINTHSKIHSEERNYKCDQCEKAFKNSKQLKNHRRWHRNNTPATTTATTATTASTATAIAAATAALHRCIECGSAFSHLKTLREHMCKQSVDTQKVMRCEICDRVVSSKSSLKLHMRTHEAASRFKCTACDYRANDHNAFRRHKMTHEKSKMYVCPFCDYKSIQSVAYQKHLQQKHPELVDNIVHKCSECNFTTINRSLLTIHQAKHSSGEGGTQSSNDAITNGDLTLHVTHTTLSTDEQLNLNETESSAHQQHHEQQQHLQQQHPQQQYLQQQYTQQYHSQQQCPQQHRNKIKVKSDLVLTDPAKFSKNTNSNSVTSLLVHCFDNAIT